MDIHFNIILKYYIYVSHIQNLGHMIITDVHMKKVVQKAV